MATLVKIRGQVPVLTDDELRLLDWLEFDGKAWIVGMWLLAVNGKTQRPLRIIAPKVKAVVWKHMGSELLRIFEMMPVPERLIAQGFLPPELEHQFEVIENPDIYAKIETWH